MRILIILILVTGFWIPSWSQSTVKMKLKDNQTIQGTWLGMEDDHYLVQYDNGSTLYVPAEMVLKLKLYRSHKAYPRYDNNRSTLLFGWSGDLNTNIGQGNAGFAGAGVNASVGYDWDHRYSLAFSMGYRNMNIGRPETFLPVTVTAKKYLTHGRYLLFGGIEAGYQWGLKNQWHTLASSGTWEPWGSQFRPAQSMHDKGGGPSVAPLLGVRKIGKYGFDQILTIGLHIQHFHSEKIRSEDARSEVDLLYQRWRVSYGMAF